MRRTYRTLNDYEMQRNAEVGLFTRPSRIDHLSIAVKDYKKLISDLEQSS